MSNFGMRLKYLREEHELTLIELADKLNTTKSTLSRYENCKMDPTLDSAVTIAKFFNVTLDWLAGENDDNEVEKYKYGKYTKAIDMCIDNKIEPDRLEKMIELMKG